MPDYTVVESPRVMSADDATKLVGDDVPTAPPTVVAATVAVDSDTHSPVFAYLPLDHVGELRRAVLGFPYGEGVERGNGLRNRSRVFGFSPRRPVYRQEGCKPSTLATEHPPEHAVITRYADHLAYLLGKIDPNLVTTGRDAVSVVDEGWRLGESKLWTSGVINQSSVLPYHRDGFNFPAWSAMPVLRRHMDGGYLRIPEYGAVIPCRDGWGVFFAGYDLVHGVTPMRLRRDDGYRYSVVYYALRGMKNCFEHAVEAAYAKKRRTDREQDMARRLTEGEARGGRTEDGFPAVDPPRSRIISSKSSGRVIRGKSGAAFDPDGPGVTSGPEGS